MGLPVYMMTYECRKCGTYYSGKWDPNQSGHVEPATACPSCGSPVRVFRGAGQALETADETAEAAARRRLGPKLWPVSGGRRGAA